MLEVFNNLFMAIAEEMGLALQNTASSVNIKERLDFSCALFDATARSSPMRRTFRCIWARWAIPCAPSLSRAATAKDGRGIRQGDVYVLNAPYHGGSHLPDVTVIMPAFDAAGELVAFVASRGHHADIGGITPGSMPPFSRTVEEEGVLIDNFLLVDEGRFRETETNALLAFRPLPCAQSAPEHRRSQGPSGRLREGHDGAARADRSRMGARPCTPICVMCRTMPRNACAA